MKTISKCLCMAFFLLVGMNAVGQTYVNVGDLKYQLDGTEAYVVGFATSEGVADVVIPETIESDGLSFRVTKVSTSAFYGKTIITNLVSEKCTTIGSQAFQNCTNLNEIKLKCSTIGYSAFQSCTSLQRATLDVCSIEHEAFSGCSSLEKLLFGTRLEQMDYYAFKNCVKISSVVIPQICKYHISNTSVRINNTWTFEIGFGPYGYSANNNTFTGCNRLQSIIYLGDQTSKCGSNAAVYNAKDWGTWSGTSFDYSGSAPVPTLSYTDQIAGFQITDYQLDALEKDAGTYTTTVPVTFSNGDIAFTVDKEYTYTINPAPLTARVKDATRMYGEGNPQFETEYSGFLTGEDETVITNHGSYTTSATVKSDVGSYTLSQSGVTAKNYAVKYESGTLTVTKAPLTMTARNKTMDYGSKVPTLEVDYEGLKNSEAKPTWTMEPTITTTASTTSDAGTYPITISDGEAKNYNVTMKPGTMTIRKVALTATTMNTNREYGDENPEFEMTYSGLKNNEQVPEWTVEPTIVTPATKTSPVGTYSINASGGEAKNYYVEYVNTGKLTVDKAILKATARSLTKKQGENNPTMVIDYEGWKNNETSLVLTQEPIATTTATLNSRPGTYPITVSDGVAMNYEFEYVNGTLTVYPANEPETPTVNMLELSSLTANKNTQVTLPIALTNEKQITGLQMDLYLPTGVTVATNSKGKLMVETTARMDGNYTLTCSAMNGFVRILGYSADGDAFSGNTGAILNVTLNVGDNMNDGDYTIRIKDIVLSDVGGVEHHPADVGATLTVESYVLGDVDNSGAININDVVCIINHILNRPVTTFIAEAADVDGSGIININDVVQLINRFILNRSNSRAITNERRKTPDLTQNFLHLDAISIAPGETKDIQLLMTNSDQVAAIQGNIKLPQGLTFATNDKGKPIVVGNEERADDFTLSCEIQNDGSLTFAQYSGDGYTYDGNEGHVLTFRIKADANATTGTYEVLLSAVTLSIDGVGYDLANRTSSLTIENGMTLDENATSVPEVANGVDVRVKRTINAGEWSTICLPFAMSQAQCQAAFGSDVQIGDFTGCTVVDDNVSVNFSNVTAIEANHPYIIKVSSAVSEFTVDGVDIAADNAEVKVNKSGRKYNRFIGNYENGTELEDGFLFLNANKFYFSNGSTKIKAFRGYFNLETADAYYEESRRIVLNFGDATGIETIVKDEADKVFNLGGQRVKTPAKGLYIKNGKKIIVK